MRYPTILLAAMLAVAAMAQVTGNTTGSTPANRRATTAKGTKAVVPDPDILDGSKLEPEKRPLYGMISEIEMGEQPGGQQDKVSPNSGPAGGSQAGEKAGSGGREGPPGQGAAPTEKIAEGPETQPDGIQVKNLKVPEGGAGEQAGGGKAPRELQIGDATLQIQTPGAKTQNVVGVESSTSQQYEKKVPAGGPEGSTNRNRGVEKGRDIPKGL